MRRKFPKAKADDGTEKSKAGFFAGWREIGGKRIYFRSRWEPNYARYLEAHRLAGNILAWEYEPKTFWFDGIRRGVVSYKPDFKVTLHDTSHKWHEVKGRMDHRSTLTLKRMAKFYPHEEIVLIDGPAYAALEALYGHTLPGWELPEVKDIPAALERRIR